MVQWSVTATCAVGITGRLHRSAAVSRVSCDLRHHALELTVCFPPLCPRRVQDEALPSEKRQRIGATRIILFPDAKRA
jgi:hypothetical protein